MVDHIPQIHMIQSVEASLYHMFHNTRTTSFTFQSSIYKVPHKLRAANEAAYTPRLVSIGPLHHFADHLQGMQHYKVRFLFIFLHRFLPTNLSSLVEFAAGEESFVRGCYDGRLDLSPQQLTQIIVLDGVFILELFLQNHFPHLVDENEMIFENKRMYNALLHDLLLLENQLPLCVLKGLLDFVDFIHINHGNKLTIYDFAVDFFKNVGNTKKSSMRKQHYFNAGHFVDLLLFLHVPVRQREEPKSPGRKLECTRSATELKQAGVKFASADGGCLFEVSFRKGVLTIPTVKVNGHTETFFRNLIAFEQCGYSSEDITSYAVFMDSLINTAHDVDLLVSCGIIQNELGESEQVADLFNHLHKEVMTEGNVFYFAKLCGDLNDYSRTWYHKMKASCFKSGMILKRDYFSNPWSFVSFLAASVLLVLTVVQTVCSILQV